MKIPTILVVVAFSPMFIYSVVAQPPPPGTPEDLASRKRADEIMLQIAVTDLYFKRIENSELMTVLKLLDSPESIDGMELLDSQISKIKTLQEKYEPIFRDIIERMNKNPEKHDEISIELGERRREVAEGVRTTLTPEQIRLLSNALPRKGDPLAAIVNPLLARKLELTEQQLEKIKKNNLELAAKIKKQTDELRREAFRNVVADLTQEQTSRLYSIIPENELKHFFEHASLETIYSSIIRSRNPRDLDELRVAPTNLDKR